MRGEVTCGSCGAVKEARVINQGPEWRAFTAEDRNKRTRTGSPAMMSSFDKGLSTDFNPYTKDGKGAQLQAKTRNRYARLHKWHSRNRMADSRKRNLSQAFNELEKMCSQLHIPANSQIKEDAAYYYRKTKDYGVNNGCSINGMITACLLAACRHHKRGIEREKILFYSPVRTKKRIKNVLYSGCTSSS
jgi:transcription initiation factor TFIIB